jgi:hypothetical protein
MTRTATLWAIAASVSLSAQASAQTPPAATPSISVTGCVAPVQRDGSTGPKAAGTQATPETAAIEANNPEPTGRYQLVDATPVGADQQPAATAKPDAAEPKRTAYALVGQEKELAKHVGHRVQIAGALMAPPAAKLPPRAAATADGIRTVQVASVKMIGTDCSVKEPRKPE